MTKGTSSADKEGVEVFELPPDVDTETILHSLQHGDLTLHGLMPWSSNYTFLGTVACDTLKVSAIYKPCRGERPLWDFDHGTLCQRELACYLVSQALGGWPAIPPTVLRDGPHGYGSLQQFIITDYDIHYFTLQDDPRYQRQFQQLAIFDYLVNNADRKGGHCLLDRNDVIWAIDHGLTFHTDYKLRTVIWEHARQKIPSALYQDLAAFKRNFTPKSKIYQDLETLLSHREVEQFRRRLNKLLKSGRFPEPYGMRDYPYPPV